MQTTENIATLLKKRQDKFVEDRTVTEREVNRFFESLERINDEELKVKLGVVEGRRCREVMPSMWAEEFDVNKYNEERDALIKYMNQVQQFCMSYNLEAMKCLS